MIHPDPLSDNESDLVPEGNDVPVLYHQHYADVESEEVEESPDSRLQSMESETKPIKVNSLVEDH